jgi:hypothetical protein
MQRELIVAHLFLCKILWEAAAAVCLEEVCSVITTDWGLNLLCMENLSYHFKIILRKKTFYMYFTCILCKKKLYI